MVGVAVSVGDVGVLDGVKVSAKVAVGILVRVKVFAGVLEGVKGRVGVGINVLPGVADGVGALAIGSGIVVCVSVGSGLAVGGCSVTVGLQEMSRRQNKVKERIFRM